MIRQLRRRLRLVFSRGPWDEQPAAPVVQDGPPAALPEVDFVAYAEDSWIFGHIGLDAERLTDMLNSHEEFALVDVRVTSLADGRTVESAEVLISRDELLAVHASGPRGNLGRRLRTRSYPVALRAGPYLVRGYVHALRGADPLASARRRKPMIPLTQAWIEYMSGDHWERQWVGTLIVNRELTDWIKLGTDEDVAYPGRPLFAETGLRLKDRSGHLPVR